MAKDDALNDRLKKLRENLNEFSQGIISSNKKLIKSFDNFSEKIKASLTKHTEAVKTSTTSIKSFSKSLDKLTPNLKSITDAAQKSSKSLQGMKKASDTLSEQANTKKKGAGLPVAPLNKTAPQPQGGGEESPDNSGSDDALRYFVYGVIGNQFSKVGRVFAEVKEWRWFY